jgi:hypothetical protein
MDSDEVRFFQVQERVVIISKAICSWNIRASTSSPILRNFSKRDLFVPLVPLAQQTSTGLLPLWMTGVMGKEMDKTVGDIAY